MIHDYANDFFLKIGRRKLILKILPMPSCCAEAVVYVTVAQVETYKMLNRKPFGP